MKRALGNADEAATLYREILAKDKTDIAARTGLILSLFNSGRQAEAEDEMAESLVDTPNNVPLLVGAAYWYATRNNGAKAIDLATQALKIEPRYTWGYIALARGLMKQNQPIAAETALLNARQFGNFPTISYELALAQSAAGFYKEAAEELKKNFTIENGKVVASLGGRVVAEGDNFIELLSLERKAGIFEPTDANDLETAKKLKQLLEFENKLDAKTPDESEIAIAAENFANGNDSMKTHRDLYAANRLLEKKIALPKALELTKNAVTGVDSAINVPNPTSAVLADELYEARILAKSRGQNVIVPDIPPATLSKIIRGRIEETAGWTLYEQGNYEAALAKLNLAMSILPKDSAWWRSVYWKRGTVFLAMEKPNDALDSYIKSYASEIANSEPSTAKKIVVETLYQQINGSLEGLEEKLVIPVKTSTDTTAVFVQEPVTDKKEEPRQRSNKNVPEIVPIAKSTPKTSPNTAANTAVNKNILENIPEENVATAKTESVPIAVTENIPETTPVPAEFPENPETTLPEEEVLTKEITSIETLPSPILFESTVVKKPTENKKVIVEDPTTGTSLENDTKPLFDPVIIDVPKTDFEKPAKASEKTKNINPESTSNEPAGTTRPRIVVLNNEKTTEVSECGITVSQEVVSIINNGGNLGVLVGLTNGNEPKNIKAVSSSPKDILILYEPEIGGVAGQGFFLIKSISTNKGAYTVTFDTACGKKEILVKVR